MLPDRARRSPAWLCALWLCSAPVQAQFAAYDFGDTSCAAELGSLRAGFEDNDALAPTGRASGGSGGAFPGAQSLQVYVPDTGRTHTVLLYLPSSYAPSQTVPLVLALHGAAGSAANAPNAAASIRALWSSRAENQAAIVVAPIASGASGGWVPGIDQPALACALDAVARQYNVDLDRRYLWGFSAGAHFGHAIALGNPGRFAAYAINAGALYVVACTPPGGGYDCVTTLPQMPRRIPVSLRVGSSDALQAYVSGDYARFRNAGWGEDAEVVYAEFVGGHSVSSADIEAAWAWFAPRSLRVGTAP